MTAVAVGEKLHRRLASAAADVRSARGISVTSPLIAFPVAYLLAYGFGAVLRIEATGEQAPVILAAIPIGFVAYVLGCLVGWKSSSAQVDLAPRRSRFDTAVAVFACSLVVVGLASLGAYLAAIGEIPLFMDSVEQGRVDVAEIGGAPLRVLSLLSLPGTWLLAGVVSSRRSVKGVAGVVILAGIVAGLHLLTANRAPAFGLVQVTTLAIVLGLTGGRLSPRKTAGLVTAALLLVVAAGYVGAHRYAATPSTWRDPAIAEGVATGNNVLLSGKALSDYLVVPVQNFSATLTAVPELIGWRLGSTYLQPLATVLPGTQSTFDQDLKAALDQQYAGGGTVPSLLGEAYANFGPVGWVVVPLLIGFGLTRLYFWTAQYASAGAIVLFAYATLHMANSTIGGILVANVFPYVAYTLLAAAAVLPRLGPGPEKH